METLVLKRTTPMDALFSFLGAREQVRMVKKTGKVSADVVIDPKDYDNDTDYLMAIPGMKEKLISGMNAPSSKCRRVPKEYFNV